MQGINIGDDNTVHMANIFVASFVNLHTNIPAVCCALFICTVSELISYQAVK